MKFGSILCTPFGINCGSLALASAKIQRIMQANKATYSRELHENYLRPGIISVKKCKRFYKYLYLAQVNICDF